MKKFTTICLVMALSSMTIAGQTGWETFVIRGNASVSDNVTAPDSTSGWTLFDVSSGGEKAGWGTNNMNGQTIGDIQSLSITRYVPESGDTTYAPYFNIWITDGNGEYAVLANEPSNPEWNIDSAYDTTWDIMKDKSAKIYEYTAAFAKPAGATYTFADFAGYTIENPSTHWGGTGAPDDINASVYTAYGFNWVFGDTQSNYVGGHLAKNPTLVSAVPVPGAFLLGGIGAACVGWMRRRKSL